MITGEIKLKIDKIWDTMWSGGISNPLSVIEQLTYLLFTKTNSGGTDQVWFYDMQRDGFSLDDKRTPRNDSDLADILARWKNVSNAKGDMRNAEWTRPRTEQSFGVPMSELRANDYDLSINRYKEVAYEAVEYDPPQVILKRLAKLEEGIAGGRRALEGLSG